MAQLLGKRRKKHQRDALLSAYLDNQLSKGEQAQLEAQLAADPELRANLEALRQTIEMVRNLPRVQPPRNLILQPEATHRRPAPSARPTLGWGWTAPLLTGATVIIGLLFFAALVGSLALPSVGEQAAAPQAPRIAVSAVPIPTPTAKSMPEENATTEPALFMAAEERSLTETSGLGAEEASAEETALPDVPASGGLAESTAPAISPSLPPSIPTSTPAPPQPTVSLASSLPTEVAEAGAPLPTGPTQEAESPTDAGASSPETYSPLASLWTASAVALGLLTLGLALATALAWRSRRRYSSLWRR